MREIKVKNASITTEIEGKKIGIEIRTTKDSERGIAIYIKGKKAVELNYTKDGEFVFEFTTDLIKK